MSAFQPNEFNAEFDHQASVREMFAAIGFTDLSIKTVLTNGCSHYVTLSAEVIDKSKMYTSVFMYEDFPVTITVRVSDHRSGLDAVGVDGDKMTFAAFNKLVESGAIAKHA